MHLRSYGTIQMFLIILLFGSTVRHSDFDFQVKVVRRIERGWIKEESGKTIRGIGLNKKTAEKRRSINVRRDLHMMKKTPYRATHLEAVR